MILSMGHGEGGGRPPFGWVATGGGAEAFAPVPAEMAVLRRISELRDLKFTMAEIAEDRNATGYRTKMGAPWTSSKVFYALHTIRRFGIPDDIDAAILSAHEKTAAKKGGDQTKTDLGSSTFAKQSVTRVARGN
jgi:hypothetical protein